MRGVFELLARRAPVLAVLAVLGCASAPEGEPDAVTHVGLDEQGRLTYSGSITSAANRRAMELYAEAEEKPGLLLVSSGGGSVEAALDLAEWILELGLSVEVGDLCFSSCANYLFVAGRTRRLARESILGWHGSTWQESFDPLADPDAPEYIPSFADLRAREVEFFARAGVDNVITVYGLGKIGIWGWIRARIRGSSWLGFDYSLADLERLGVSDVVLTDGEWRWREHNREFAARVRRVTLDDDYEFRLNRFGGR